LAARKAIFVHSPQFEKYHYPPDCPFNISRAGKLQKIISSMGLLTGSSRCQVAPQPAERTILEKFHSDRYLDALQAAAKGDFSAEFLYMGIGTPDCPIFSDMYDYGIWACGATLTGANLILSGDAELAFNPSGGLHHAGPELAAGFCYINDVALACLVLAEAGKRVLYLDIDVHHGDGVQNTFYDRNDVMTISFHQNGRTLFPGTGFEDEIGTGAGKGYSVNVPLPIGTDDEAYMKAFTAIAPPLIEAYKPDCLVFELGADTLAGDPLANLQLTNNTYADIIYRLLDFGVPILMTGGGGYNIDNTVRAWALAWSVLCGADLEDRNASIGLGGVMLESTDWFGGLRDRHLPVNAYQHDIVTRHIEKTIEFIRTNIFPLHGLSGNL
jgi:acetoin utilization protein AcuC